MHNSYPPQILHAAAVLMLAIAAEDGNVDQREVGRANEDLAGWGRTDRVTGAQAVHAAFQEMGNVWQIGGNAELERHLWSHADILASSGMGWHALHDLVQILRRIADADGKLERAELGLIEALAAYFDREAGPPEDMEVADLLARFDAEARGPRWTERFHTKIGKSILEVGAPGDAHATTPRLVEGPGGIRLAEARVQPRGGRQLPFIELARWCTDEGLGLMIEPEWSEPPGYVLRYGELWSFRAFEGSFTGPAALGRELTLDELLPQWAREQIARVFGRYGVPGRQVAYLIAPSGEPALVFDAPASYLPAAERHGDLELELRQMSPPGTVFLTVDPQQGNYPFEPL